MRSIRVIFLQVLLITIASADGSREAHRRVDSRLIGKIASGGTNFTMGLFNTILHEKDGNLIFSPLSVQLALALLYPGTRGDSAALLARALDFPASLDDVYRGYSDLMTVLKHPKLKIANRIFVDESAKIRDDYKRNAERYFQAGAQTVSFRKDLTKSINLINRWVEEVTNDKIKDLLQPGSLKPDTRAVLVNAIHFKAKWKNEFESVRTIKHPFYVSKIKQVNVKMMRLNGYFNHHHDTILKAKIISIPFKGDRYKMYVVLPDEVDGLNTVIQHMNAGTGWDSNTLREEFLKLSLPKFKVEMEITLNEILEKHGLGLLFTPAADLSGLSDECLSVSKVAQKAVVHVNEGGVEAAAATAMNILKRMRTITPNIEFKANRPFLFIIKAIVQANEVPLFVGRYTGPDSS